MKLLKWFLFALVLILLWSAPTKTQTPSVLAVESAAMAVGEFREITTQMVNLNNASVPGYFSNVTGEDIFQFDSNTFVVQYTDLAGKWDPVARKMHGDWMSHTGYWRHIVYDDATNRWSMIADNWGGSNGQWYNGTNPANPMTLQHPNFSATGPSALSPTSHSYHNFTINTSGRYYYHWAATTPKINRLHLDTGVWDHFTDINQAVVNTSGQDGVLLWVPNLNGGLGGLIFTPGGTGWAYSNVSNQWAALIDQPANYMGQRGNFAEFSTVANLALLGGGIPITIAQNPFDPAYQNPNHAAWGPAKKIFSLAANRTVTAKTDAPFPIYVTLSVNTVDPATGEFLFLFLKSPLATTQQFTELWSYNVTTDTWTKRKDGNLPFDPSPIGQFQGLMAAPISTYGVTMWVKHEGHQTRVWLYKHGASVAPPPGDTTPPSVSLTAPSNGATVSGGVTMSATASDAIGVIGVTFRLDGNPITAEDQSSPYSIVWDSTQAVNGTHTLSALARDAAGNSATSSVSVTVSNTPSTSTFAQKIAALGAAVIGAYGFDSIADVRDYPAGVEPIRYGWLRNGEGDAYHNVLVGPECDQAFAAIGQTWVQGGLGAGQSQAFASPLINPARCIFPVIDNSTYYTSGGGTGSIRLTMPTKSWANATGLFKAPMGGQGDTNFVGPGGSYGNVFYSQYLYRMGSTANTFIPRGANGWKLMILQGDGALSAVHIMSHVSSDPGCRFGEASCPNGSEPLFAAYGSIGNDIWTQEVRGCGFNYNNMDPLYQEPPCFLVHNQTWYEFTTRIEMRPSAVNASTPGAGSTVLNWPGGRFAGNGFTDIYIESGTNCVAGMYHVAAVNSATQVVLDTSPTPAGAGSNCVMYYSYDNNSKVQVWVNGVLTLQSETAKFAWGPHGAGLGFNNFNLNVYMTGKDETQDHPSVDIWYDDVLFATAPIPMSGGVVTPPPPPPVNVAPVVSFIPDQSVTLPATATLTATVSDDGRPFNTLSYQWSGAGVTFGTPLAVTTTAVAAAGSHTITFTASDGQLQTSRTMTLTVNSAPPPPPPTGDVTAPTVSVTLPANNAMVNGTITLTSSATDNIGVVGVQFTVDSFNVGAEDLTSPYSITWNTASVAGGSHLIRAVARDAAGNSATSAAITVFVDNTPPPTPDTAPPSVAFASPPNASKIAGTITLTAIATDNVSVASVRFFANNVLISEDTASPYTATWASTGLPDSTVTLSAVARDTSGNQATTTITVTVQNTIPTPPPPPPGPVDRVAPVVRFLTTNGTTFTGGTQTIRLSTADNVGVTDCFSKVNGAPGPAVSAGGQTSAQPLLTLMLATPRTYIIGVTCQDAAGNRTTAVNISVVKL